MQVYQPETAVALESFANSTEVIGLTVKRMMMRELLDQVVEMTSFNQTTETKSTKKFLKLNLRHLQKQNI